jgi:hypothetical protein
VCQVHAHHRHIDAWCRFSGVQGTRHGDKSAPSLGGVNVGYLDGGGTRVVCAVPTTNTYMMARTPGVKSPPMMGMGRPIVVTVR